MSSPSGRKNGFIVFEGIDGTGKSTQIQKLAHYLSSLGFSLVTGFEPTMGKWGGILRESMTTGRLNMEQEIDLFLKDRKDNVDHFIKPHLEQGDFVLLDRYYFSTMAYQGARGYDPQILRKRNEEFAPVPDLVLWLDIPVETALNRIGGRGKANEFEKADQLEMCRTIFSSIHEPWFCRIDASGSPEQVAALVQSVVDECFALPLS